MRYTGFLLFFVMFNLVSCDKPITQDSINKDETWLIPTEEIVNFGTQTDPVVAIDNPTFVPVGKSRLKDDAMVYVIQKSDVIKIYPLSVLATHEIVNDNIADSYFAATYCPITASVLVWNRKIRGRVSTFGVSGMLYNENLMPYDRNTGSIWSQMRMECVHGTYLREKPQILPGFSIRFGYIKNTYPGAMVLVDTFSLTNKIRNAKHTKLATSYFGVVDGRNHLLFSIDDFKDSVRLIHTRFRTLNLFIAGSSKYGFVVAYVNTNPRIGTAFQAVQDAFPIIFKDNLGNRFDVFGKVVIGPSRGEQLTPALGFTAKDWAWEAFYSEASIYSE